MIRIRVDAQSGTVFLKDYLSVQGYILKIPASFPNSVRL